MNILDKIVAHKKLEVQRRKAVLSTKDLEKKPLFARRPLSFRQFLTDPEKTGIIAEFKRQSPSKGVINGTADVTMVTKAYASNGASCLSVLTDEQFFGGGSEDLEKARTNPIPILRKDFMIDEYQVVEARAMGADTILLIAACLEPGEVRRLAAFAKSLELEVLLEIHNEEELGHICEETDLVGVNNRDLKTFIVDIRRSIELSEKIPAGKITISESGISEVETIIRLKNSGFRGFLIGENFMKQKDPALAFEEFAGKLKSAMLKIV
jgi:indole-3-glycerol phosphate synthase